MTRRKGPAQPKPLRELARSAARAAGAAAARAPEEDPEAAQLAQRVYNAVREARRTGESGDVSPLIWAPLAVAAELMAVVVIESNGLPKTEEMHVDVAAYFTAGFIAGGHGFDFAHFEQWRRRSVEGDAPDIEPG